MHLSDLINAAYEATNFDLLCVGDEIYTAHSLFGRAASLASYLRDEVPTSQSIAVTAQAPVHAAVALLAALIARRTVALINPALSPGDQQAQLLALGTAFILDAASIDECAKSTRAADLPNHPAPVERAAIVVFTSGSTGAPKAILHSERSLFAIIERSLVLYPDGVDLISMPMHSLGGIQCFLVNLALQRCLVLPQNNELIAFCKAARDTQPRTILGFPSYAAALLDGRDTKELRETVEVIHTGGEKLTAATRAALEDGLGCRVYPAYGMAEFGAISVNRETSPERLEALGDLLPGVNIRLDPVFGTKQTDMGELVVSGASLMLGYRHADGQFDPAGQWLKTGDILRRDSAGILWHMGRKSDFVAHEDTSVSLAEIERFLAADPTLKASAAVAKPTRGVAVFIKLSPHAAQDEVRANIFGRIEKQWPGLITKNDVHTFEELPLNAAGKVDRTYLSSVAADNLVSAT